MEILKKYNRKHKYYILYILYYYFYYKGIIYSKIIIVLVTITLSFLENNKPKL